MSREAIMHKLYEKDYIDTLHRNIKEGLIGSLRNEYLMQKPLREPYEQYVAHVNTFVALPVFHAIVDMMIANLIHSTCDKITTEIIDVIEETPALLKRGEQNEWGY